MEIHGLVVCVDFARELALGLPRWIDGLASLTVVTSPDDAETHALARAHARTRLHATRAFYAHGATFDKAAAMNEAIADHPFDDWVLFFDADVVPPPDWADRVRAEAPEPGRLYGARRKLALDPAQLNAPDLPAIPDAEVAGYFQLFHGRDPRAAARPLLDDGWMHAGNYDSAFQERWRSANDGDRRRVLDLWLVHVGRTGTWFGRGPVGDEMMRWTMAERRRTGRMDHERVRKG